MLNREIKFHLLGEATGEAENSALCSNLTRGCMHAEVTGPAMTGTHGHPNTLFSGKQDGSAINKTCSKVFWYRKCKVFAWMPQAHCTITHQGRFTTLIMDWGVNIACNCACVIRFVRTSPLLMKGWSASQYKYHAYLSCSLWLMFQCSVMKYGVTIYNDGDKTWGVPPFMMVLITMF